jgi:hypothetical protein
MSDPNCRTRAPTRGPVRVEPAALTDHIPNQKLTPALVPSGDADFAGVIFPFAMTYHAYDVWGDFETVRDVAAHTWAVKEQSGVLPTSLTKLRTSLFAAARYMRMTDFDEDIAGVPGAEAAWIDMMREHIAAIEQTTRRGPEPHLQFAGGTVEAAAELRALESAEEYQLRVAVGNALETILGEPVSSSASQHEHTFRQLPLWAKHDPPGPFDLIIGDVAAPRFAAEVKLADRNTLSHTLWDVLKLLGVLALTADHAYLIAGFPTRVWAKAKFAPLYTTGTVPYTSLPIEKEWPSLLADSKGTPLRIPNALEVTEISRVHITRDGESYEIKTVAIEPAIGGWLELRDGRLDGAQPYEPDSPA